MLYVKCPATSANLGPGFDTIGVALSMYNTFGFEKNNKYILEGFINKYQYAATNLVIIAYKSVFEYLNIEEKPVKVVMVEQEIPASRGLGSSATCIVAGILAANYFNNNCLSLEEMLKLATKLEGHPDNVAPCLKGGLVASFVDKNEVISINYPISPLFSFYVLISSQESKTSKMRKVLPLHYPLSTIVSNSARLINLPYALSLGDIKLLKKVMVDYLHEPYRLPLINNGLEIKKEIEKKDAVLVISGAGSSLLVITTQNLNFNDIVEKYNFKVKKLNVVLNGAEFYEK